MTINHRALFVACMGALLLLTEASHAQAQSTWDGTWKGAVGRIEPQPISISIANDKVVGYTVGGAPLDVQYYRVTPTSVSFGDRDNYFMKLRKTSDATASGKVHGRIGYGSVRVTKD